MIKYTLIDINCTFLQHLISTPNKVKVFQMVENSTTVGQSIKQFKNCAICFSKKTKHGVRTCTSPVAMTECLHISVEVDICLGLNFK